MLESNVGDNVKKLMTDLRCWCPIPHTEKVIMKRSHQHNNSIYNHFNDSVSSYLDDAINFCGEG